MVSVPLPSSVPPPHEVHLRAGIPCTPLRAVGIWQHVGRSCDVRNYCLIGVTSFLRNWGLEFADGFLRFLVFPGSYAFAPLFAYLLVGLLPGEDLNGYISIAPEEFTELQLIH